MIDNLLLKEYQQLFENNQVANLPVHLKAESRKLFSQFKEIRNAKSYIL